MTKRASKQGGPKIGYFIQSRGPGDRVEFEEVYVYGPTRRRALEIFRKSVEESRRLNIFRETPAVINIQARAGE
jgi:hypothetical protein